MEKKLVRTNGVVWEEVDGQALVVDTKANRSWLLNSTATLIWRHCDGARSLVDLAAALARKSGAEARRIEREVMEFCGGLERAGLLAAKRPAEALTAAPMAFAGLSGSYSPPAMLSRSLASGPRKRPSPRGNSGPG
ncbi:MAG TPA: PqqD family protein [Planctomycetota bacterium]|nr:PqqD family protein [Planctomycetota bacterium]